MKEEYLFWVFLTKVLLSKKRRSKFSNSGIKKKKNHLLTDLGLKTSLNHICLFDYKQIKRHDRIHVASNSHRASGGVPFTT